MSAKKSCIVFDIGGTAIKSACIDNCGEMLHKRRTPTPQSYSGFLELIHHLIGSLPSAEAAVCSIPGVYDRLADKVLFTPNIPYLPGKSLVSDIQCDMPVFVENDANMATLGEYYYGFDTPPESFVFLTLGTGVGAGIVLGGKLLTGRLSGVEAGHMTLVAEGRLCGCGKRGCLEQYCSASAILKDYASFSGDKAPITAEEVAGKMEQGDPAAVFAFNRFSLYLAHGISSLINIITPEAIRIGGGLSELSPCFFPHARKLLEELVFPAYRGNTDIAVARLKNDAALAGGAAWAGYLLR